MPDIDLTAVGPEAPAARPARGQLRTVRSLLGVLDHELLDGAALELVAIPTGFSTLDRVLGGGLHPGALTVLGGAPGVGKTILALQWARNMARDGHPVVFACYEHDESELLLRLVCQELDALDPDVSEQVRSAVSASARTAGRGLIDILTDSAAADDVLGHLAAYADRLHLVRATGGQTGLRELEGYLDSADGVQPILVVDYLQKVHMAPDDLSEGEKVRRVVEELKDLALARAVPVVAVVSTDMEGIRARRTRMHHFRGSSALAFEADVVLVLNGKFDAVAKVHLAYDQLRAKSFHDWVVLSVEKNRAGPSPMHLELLKDFSRFRFVPDGGLCAEQLVDERFDEP